MALPAVSVLVVDDQAPFRTAARLVVRATAGFDVIGEARSGEEAVEAVATAIADLEKAEAAAAAALARTWKKLHATRTEQRVWRKLKAPAAT